MHALCLCQGIHIPNKGGGVTALSNAYSQHFIMENFRFINKGALLNSL